tara:strand:- start:152 stop:277 length:126 start_codon:yes stop_codon:yes gene_type:complete
MVSGTALFSYIDIFSSRLDDRQHLLAASTPMPQSLSHHAVV